MVRDVFDKNGKWIAEDHRDDIKEDLFKEVAKYPTLSEILENFEAIKPTDKGEMGDDLHEMDITDRMKHDPERFNKTNYIANKEDKRNMLRRKKKFRRIMQTKWNTFEFGLWEDEDQSNALDKIQGRKPDFKPYPKDYAPYVGYWPLEVGEMFKNAGRKFGQEIIKLEDEGKHGLENLLVKLHMVILLIVRRKGNIRCPWCDQVMEDFPEDLKCPGCGKDEWSGFVVMQSMIDNEED